MYGDLEHFGIKKNVSLFYFWLERKQNEALQSIFLT